MDSFFVALKARNSELKDIIKECKKQLKALPEGRLRIDARPSGPQYYRKVNGCEEYLCEGHTALAKDLAQRRYYEKLLRQSELELSRMENLIKVYHADSAASLWEKMSPQRKELVIPLSVPDEEYVKQWSEVEYLGMVLEEDEPSFLTERGEKVRSKSEKIIADMMSLRGVPYRYEYPILMKGRYFYPDFTALNVRTRNEFIWEHFGMMDNPEYARNFTRKVKAYERNGIYVGSNLICTFETSIDPLYPEAVEEMIKRFLL